MSSLTISYNIIKHNKTIINKYWLEVFNRLTPLSQSVLLLWACPLMFFNLVTIASLRFDCLLGYVGQPSRHLS